MSETPELLHDAVLREAVRGLSATPKTLSPWLFYDELGSQLFEQITELPEYYLTRTERAIFSKHASELAGKLQSAVTIAELGAGSASKTGILLREFAQRQAEVLYQPIDVSASALEEAAASIRAGIPGVRVEPQVANYITDRYTILRPQGYQVLAMYIGSSIGNFSPEEATGILQNLRSHLEPSDALLLGVDLAPSEHKSVETLLAAYDDAAGVTAAFNKNVLVRLNHELKANFDLEHFVHRARWNSGASRIEMHLESTQEQIVTVAGNKVHFAQGETIHTESSHKFTEAGLNALLLSSGFKLLASLKDDDRRYAVALAEAV